jgi:Ca-activated chloride channel homolog
MRTLSLVLALSSLLQPQVFRSGVELVRIPISLAQVEPRTSPASSLGPADFSILEDGVRQEIALFERESMPVRVCILLDISHSMLTTSASRLSLGTYGHVISLLAPSDEVSVVTFAMGNDVVMPWRSASKAADHQLKLISEGGTAIVDAVKAGMRQIDKAAPGRALILVITDGGENASAAALSDVVATRRQSETEIYAFKVAGTPGASPVIRLRASGGRPVTKPQPTIDVLPQLVAESGGLIYNVDNEAEVPALAKNFVDDIRTRYTLAYTPRTPFDGKYRRITVETSAAGYSVRHRSGYLASPMK